VTTKSILRESKPVNVREAQAGLSRLIKMKKPSLVLSRGKPVSFLVPYEDMLDLLEMLDDLKDKTLLEEISRARTEYIDGKEVSAEKLFRKMGL